VTRPGGRALGSAAAAVTTAAAQLRHPFRVLTMLGAVLSELAVCGHHAGTTGMGALLLIHDPSSPDARSIVAQRCGSGAVARPDVNGERQG
jgi:hypothetical protein